MILDVEYLQRRWLWILLFALGALVLWLGYTYAMDSPFRLHTSVARAKLLKGELTTVVDVRTDIEYWAGHYPGAVHIPAARLLEEAYQMLPNLEEGILIYCNTGQRARHATEVLRSLGYKNVYYVATPHWSLM
jgi:rhodanese-related sulfurtransferase